MAWRSSGTNNESMVDNLKREYLEKSQALLPMENSSLGGLCQTKHKRDDLLVSIFYCLLARRLCSFEEFRENCSVVRFSFHQGRSENSFYFTAVSYNP